MHGDWLRALLKCAVYNELDTTLVTTYGMATQGDVIGIITESTDAVDVAAVAMRLSECDDLCVIPTDKISKIIIGRITEDHLVEIFGPQFERYTRRGKNHG